MKREASVEASRFLAECIGRRRSLRTTSFAYAVHEVWQYARYQ